MTVFDEQRRRLFGIAYRMLGSVMEAEDIVQEAYLRWRRVDQAEVRDAPAYLAKMVTRLCLDYLKQARVQRELYVGEWLPEPLPTGQADGEDMLMLAESLSFAFLVMLQSLTPIERAVFLLREVFDYSYDEIGDAVDKTPTHCRQILRRAKQRVHLQRPKYDVDQAEHAQLISSFVQATLDGDMTALVATLDDSIVLWSDGGGKVPAALHPLRGRETVARFLHGLTRIAAGRGRAEVAAFNGQPGLLLYLNDELAGVMLFHTEAGHIRNIYTIRNPDKLRHLAGRA